MRNWASPSPASADAATRARARTGISANTAEVITGRNVAPASSISRDQTTRPTIPGSEGSWETYTSRVQGHSGSVTWTCVPEFVSCDREMSMSIAAIVREMPP